MPNLNVSESFFVKYFLFVCRTANDNSNQHLYSVDGTYLWAGHGTWLGTHSSSIYCFIPPLCNKCLRESMKLSGYHQQSKKIRWMGFSCLLNRFFRIIQWTATFGKVGATGGSYSRVPLTSSAWASKCWRDSGGRTHTFTTARTRTCTPSRFPTSCSELARKETFSTRWGLQKLKSLSIYVYMFLSSRIY